MTQFNVIFQELADVAIAKVEGNQLTVNESKAFKNQLFSFIQSALDKQRFKKLVIDLSSLQFLDSSGLGALLVIYKSLEPPMGLILCIPENEVKTAFEMTYMQKLMPIYPSLQEALQETSQGASLVLY